MTWICPIVHRRHPVPVCLKIQDWKSEKENKDLQVELDRLNEASGMEAEELDEWKKRDFEDENDGNHGDDDDDDSDVNKIIHEDFIVVSVRERILSFLAIVFHVGELHSLGR